MIKRLPLFFAILLVMLIANTAFAQSGKERVKQAVIDIEAGTSTKEAISNRQEALKWTIETDDVSLIACGATFGPFVDEKNKNSSDMTEAYMVGMAAYKLDNPTADENSVQQAGVELALKVYDRLVKEKPKTKFNAVEDLVAKREKGELVGHIVAADCGKK
jgi:hypothetical protein